MRYVVWLEDHNEWKFCLKDQPYFFMHLRFYEIYFLLYHISSLSLTCRENLHSCMKTRMLFQKLIQLILHLAWTDRIMFLLMSSIEINEQIIEHLHDLWGPDLLMLGIEMSRVNQVCHNHFWLKLVNHAFLMVKVPTLISLISVEVGINV